MPRSRARQAEVVHRMLEVAVHAARQEAFEAGVTQESPAVAPDGFPVMWAVTWRARSASWLIRHRAQLEAARPL